MATTPMSRRLQSAVAAFRGADGAAPAAGPKGRSRRFRREQHGRFWWHTLPVTDFEPPIYALLTDDEWDVMEGWYAATEARGAIGEINVPAMAFVLGLLTGNGVRRVAQLGHFYGYSALLIGFMLRHMDGQGRLVSVDIDPEATAFTQEWLDRAGLSDLVTLHVGDSADAASHAVAVERLAGDPEVLLIDSSHAYRHTLRELDLWMPRMPVGSLTLMHDTTEYATEFDPTGEGGVRRAVQEWLPAHPEVSAIALNGGLAGAPDLVYKDGCGLGILQRTS